MQKNKTLRYIVYFVGFCLLVPIAFIGSIELISWFSLRQVMSLSNKAASCKSLQSVENVLGSKYKSVDKPLELEYWLAKNGVPNRIEYDYSEGDILHIFTHRGPPYRFIYVLMNEDDTKVIKSGWSNM